MSGAPQAQWQVPSAHQEAGQSHDNGGVTVLEKTLVG